MKKMLMYGIAIFLVSLKSIYSSEYPKIDNTSGWYVGSWGFNSSSKSVQLGQVYKTMLDPSQFWKQVFYDVRVTGFKIDGQFYELSGIHDNVQFDFITDGFSQYYGEYSLRNGSQTYVVGIVFNLISDGSFEFFTYWPYSPPLRPTTTAVEAFLRMDYDLDGAGDDMILVAGKSFVSPVWDAPVTEGSRNLPLPGIITDNIEKVAFCRISTAENQERQFGAILWPFMEGGVELTWNLYSNESSAGTPSTPPSPNSGVQVASGNFEFGYGNYIYSGRDQVAWLSLKYNDLQEGWMTGVTGKLFQKPNARPMVINAYMVNGAPEPDFNTSYFDGRSVKDALDDLTNSTWEKRSKHKTFPGMSQYIANAQLHELMVAMRNESPSTYSWENSTNVRDWFSDGIVFNGYFAEEPVRAYGVMFDNLQSFEGFIGSDNDNKIDREGFILFYGLVELNYLPDNQAHEKLLASIFLHEFGHTVQFNHEWDYCGTNYWPSSTQFSGYQGTCDNGGIMSYTNLRYTVQESNIQRYPQLHLESQPWNEPIPHMLDAHPNFNWPSSLLDFYKGAPERWVKPGFYGATFVGPNSTNPPYFIPFF